MNKILSLSKRIKLEIALVFLLLIFVIVGSYAIFVVGPDEVVTNSYTVTSSDIPEGFDQFKIGYFSDTCINNREDLVLLQATVEKINKGNYDLVLFGGDLYCNTALYQDEVQKLLYSIQAPYGKFAVLGEKDLITNAETTSTLTLGGFEVLKDQSIPIYCKDSQIVLIGLESDISINSVLKTEYINYYKVVLVHTPDTFLSSNQADDSNDIDLQLSGHSHGGYMQLPLIDIQQRRIGANTFIRGMYTRNNSTIIVSNGVNVEPDAYMRLFCSPDVVSVTLNAVY